MREKFLLREYQAPGVRYRLLQLQGMMIFRNKVEQLEFSARNTIGKRTT